MYANLFFSAISYIQADNGHSLAQRPVYAFFDCITIAYIPFSNQQLKRFSPGIFPASRSFFLSCAFLASWDFLSQ